MAKMEIFQLKCFQAVVEANSFKNATGKIHVTQPALSYQIKTLEQELNTLLFHRRPGGISITDAGRVLYKYTKEIQNTIRQAEKAVDEANTDIVGNLYIGTLNSVGTYFMPSILRNIRDKYPKIKVHLLCQENSEFIRSSLLQNRIDIALISNTERNSYLKFELLLEEKISLICPPIFPLFGKKIVKIEEIQNFPYIALSSDEYDPIKKYLSKNDVNLNPIITSDNLETIKHMTEAGLGISLLPDMIISQDILDLGKKISRSVLSPELSRKLFLVTWKNEEASSAQKIFVKELKNFTCEWKNYMNSENLDLILK